MQQLSPPTNAMLVDDEWIDIFEEFNIGVLRISGRAQRQYHDLERVDHFGRGSYERALAGRDSPAGRGPA